jgi:hypothetical protein
MTGHRIHFETEGFHMTAPFELIIFVDNTILHIMVPPTHRVTEIKTVFIPNLNSSSKLQCAINMFIHPLTAISNRLNLAQSIHGLRLGDSFECFHSSELSTGLLYLSIPDDYGPTSLACIVDFIRLLEVRLHTPSRKKLILCLDAGRPALTNTVFLLGSYMILRQGKAASAVAASFHWLERHMEPYRDTVGDATPLHLG